MSNFEVGDPKPLQDGSYIIELRGDLDAKGALIMENLMSQLTESMMYRIVLDFSSVTFISSAGVGILLGIVSTLREEGGDAMFLNVSLKIKSVFRLLNLDDFFTISDSKEKIV